MSLRIVMICALMLIALSVATAQPVESSADGSYLDVRTGSVSIPLTALKKPAADLVDDKGQALDVMEAVRRAKAGLDLSRYNPAPNKIWQDRTYSIHERPAQDYPDGETGVKWLSTEADGNPYTAFYRVQALDGSERHWRLGISLISQSTSIRSALLRKLGYDVVSAKAYSRLRIVFPSEEKKKEFLESLELKDMNMESRGWLVENKPGSPSLVVNDAILETQRNESFDWHWGFIPNPNSLLYEERMANLAWVEYFSKFRAYRALIVPFTLVFIPESLERFNSKLGSIVNDHAILYHPLAPGFASATREDVIWLLKRMSSWTEKDYREIVSVAHYPESLKEIVYRKLILRVRNLFQLFRVPIPASLPNVNLDYTSPDGLVVRGRVMKEKVPGYPQRFTHGDRQSPFKDDDWWKYAGIRARTSLLTTALSELNEKLMLLKLDKAAEKHQQNIIKQIQDHFRTRPGQPLDRPVQRWGGPVGGFSVQAARHVTTGTYYGSTAAVQLVDVVSASANLGYFTSFERFPQLGVTADGRLGLNRVYPVGILQANLALKREYVHVRPLFSMEEATKISWKDLFVPHKMRNLAKTIDSQDIKDFREFVKDLKEGEVFTITDSLEAGLAGRLSTALDSLLGFEPVNFLSTLNLGADAGRVVLRQTHFMKSRGGLQIFVRNQSSQARALNFDVNYFINLMKLRAQNLQSEIKSDAFVIDYKSDWHEEDLKTEEKVLREEKEQDLRNAVASLLRGHGTELLYTKFPHQKFELEHLLKTRETKGKIMLASLIELREDHQLKIRPPRSEEDPDRDPKEDEVLLFRRRRGELKGLDLLGFTTSLIESYLNEKSKRFTWDLAQPADPNPANLPFGKAYWRQVVTERDFSGRVKDVAILQHVWGGWNMNRKNFLRLIDEISSQLGLPPEAKYQLIEKETFHSVKGIDFYRITANLSIRQTGIEKVRDLIIQPDFANKPGERARFLGRLFQKLSEKISGVRSRQADRKMMDEILRILGNGDLQNGQAQYRSLCEQYYRDQNPEAQPLPPGHWVNGTFFDCLTPWAEKLLNLSVQYPTGDSVEVRKQQVRWATDVLYVLEAQIPMPLLLKYLGEENVLYFVQVNGFRSGDEDGDLSFISNTWGRPADDFEEANGVFQFYARKTGIVSTEIDRTQGGFK
ncbi:MAG: hypothetical protein ACK5Y2_05490 [Bdellovibrionales bacterium]